MRPSRLVRLASAIALIALSVGVVPRFLAAQTPLDAIRKRAAAAKLKADALRKSLDSTRRSVEEAKAAADSTKRSIDELARVASPEAKVDAQRTPSSSSRGGGMGAGEPSTTTAGSISRSNSAKVDVSVLVPQGGWSRAFFSRRGHHAAAVVLRGSRSVVVHDGQEGPRFDVIHGVDGQFQVVWSDDGSRYAYIGRSGDEWVLMVDGKEFVRGPWRQMQDSKVPNTPLLRFTPSSRHVWFEIKEFRDANFTSRLFVDSIAGPPLASMQPPAFSPDGEHYAHAARLPDGRGVLVVDGKVAPYIGGTPRFSGDSRSLYTVTKNSNSTVVEIAKDGKRYLRGSTADLFPAPVGSMTLALVSPEGRSSAPAVIHVDGRPVAGGECVTLSATVYFSGDGKHWAVKCQSDLTHSIVVADGRRGQLYEAILSGVDFTAEGKPVYLAMANRKWFAVVAEEERGPYESVWSERLSRVMGSSATAAIDEISPAQIVGGRVGFIAEPVRTGTAQHRMAVVGANELALPNIRSLSLAPSGDRFAVLSRDLSRPDVVVDGVMQPGLPGASEINVVAGGSPRVVFSRDGRHVAWPSYPESEPLRRAIALDGRLHLTNAGTHHNLTFTPDGNHLMWIGASTTAHKHILFVDGFAILEFDRSEGLEGSGEDRWAMAEDGVLTFVAQDGGAIKRFRVTGGEGSVDAMVARGKKP